MYPELHVSGSTDSATHYVPFHNFQEAVRVVKRLAYSRAVLKRFFKKGEFGAWAEVEIAYLIARAGYRVEFSSPKAPALNPDLVAWIDGHKLNIEIMFMQRPTGGRMKLTEADRIKRAIDNKSRQLPPAEPGLIVLYNQEIKMRNLQGNAHYIQERLSKYPQIKGLIVIKDLPRRLPEGLKETNNCLLARASINNSTRYICLAKGKSLRTSLLNGLKKIFMPTLGTP